MSNEQKQMPIVESVQGRVAELEKGGQLKFPENYSPENALKSAYLILQETKDKQGRSVLESCSRVSIANSLMDMVVQGLSPAKKQCYFIPYGNSLQLSRSYFGTVAVTKRVSGLKDVHAQVVYKGDKFEQHIDINTGARVIDKHVQPLENFGTEIVGAYAVMNFEDGSRSSTLMSMKQIQAAWEQGKTNGRSPAHKNFPEEMAKKTVINRACKMALNSSDDSDVVIGAINRTTEAEYEPQKGIESEFQEVQAEQAEPQGDELKFDGGDYSNKQKAEQTKGSAESENQNAGPDDGVDF